MPPLILPFPNFDPMLIKIGPMAVGFAFTAYALRRPRVRTSHDAARS